MTNNNLVSRKNPEENTSLFLPGVQDLITQAIQTVPVAHLFQQ
jgi:hypothetical protein